MINTILQSAMSCGCLLQLAVRRTSQFSRGLAGQLVQTIQNVGNITGNFRSSISRCCTSALKDTGNRSARSKLCTCISSV